MPGILLIYEGHLFGHSVERVDSKSSAREAVHALRGDEEDTTRVGVQDSGRSRM